MYISEMYKYEKEGITYVSSELPSDAVLVETMDILNAEDGYDLIRISNNESVGANIWLHDYDAQENYREEVYIEPEEG